jgi:hypothetical protein
MSSDNIWIKNWDKHFAMSKIVAARWWHSFDANYWGEAALTYKALLKRDLNKQTNKGKDMKETGNPLVWFLEIIVFRGQNITGSP